MRTLAPLLLLAACGNDCLDLCQEYELYLSECGYGWTTAFPDRGWASIDDCYDHYWEANAAQEASCVRTAQDYQELSCY